MRSAIRLLLNCRREWGSRTVTYPSFVPDRVRFGLLALAAVLLVSLAPRPSFAISHGQTADNGTIGEPNVDLSVVSGDASDSTGASVLSIPIDLPPGTNGHQPSLALSYSSAAVDVTLWREWKL